MTVLRWLLFLPAAVVGGLLLSALLRMGSFIFPEIIRFLLCGFGGAAGIVFCGLYVVPRRNQTTKWLLIVLATLFGLLSALMSLRFSEDKMEIVIGVAMVLFAVGFSGINPEEVFNKNQTTD